MLAMMVVVLLDAINAGVPGGVCSCTHAGPLRV